MIIKSLKNFFPYKIKIYNSILSQLVGNQAMFSWSLINYFFNKIIILFINLFFCFSYADPYNCRKYWDCDVNIGGNSFYKSFSS